LLYPLSAAAKAPSRDRHLSGVRTLAGYADISSTGGCGS
jgi:hypothetical protein